MTYDARQIANWFVSRAERDDRTLSIMSLLKLTYIAHGWHLEMRNRPLFSNAIQAWQYGPVIPEVYNAFRRQGINIKVPVPSTSTPVLKEDEGFLEQIYDIYGKLGAFQLSNLTHISGGPWDIATKSGGSPATIPDELIRQHYVAKRAETQTSAANA